MIELVVGAGALACGLVVAVLWVQARLQERERRALREQINVRYRREREHRL